MTSLWSLGTRRTAAGSPESAECGRLPDLRPVGVVDIGSNSVRFVVYEGAVRAPTPLFNEKELCGLGRELSTTGRLGEAGTACALQALERFRTIAEILNVGSLRAVATAAVRDAVDGADFLAAAQAALGTEIEVLSGEREAALAAQGVVMGFQSPDGVAGDLGGGSLELVDIRDGAIGNAVTLPIGGLRLKEMTGGKVTKATSEISRAFKPIGWLKARDPEVFYAVGGTWRALAKMHMAANDYPIRVMQGYEIEAEAAQAFCEEVRRAKKPELLPGYEAVSRARRPILPYGAAALEAVLKTTRPKKVVFSVFGIREGLLYEMLPEDQRAKDPLISFCEDYARLRSRSVEHARELFDWTMPLFGPDGLDETDEERRLRKAACLLSDIGWRAHPDYRDEQSLNVIAHAALTGIGHPGRLFLALTVYARHAGPGEANGEALSPKMRQIVPQRMMQLARSLAASIRSAHLLSCGMPGVVSRTRVRLEDEVLVLEMPRELQTLNGSRLRRRFDVLAGLFKRRFELSIVD